jgi:hypothetical protein
LFLVTAKMYAYVIFLSQLNAFYLVTLTIFFSTAKFKFILPPFSGPVRVLIGHLGGFMWTSTKIN